MKMTGAQIVLECLKREGVQHIFGYPGGAVIDLYDELSRHPDIKHYLVRHEQAAVHAADGYARASDKVGVALVTSGPGATNTVTGIASAYMDSIPIVVFTGQVPTALIGNDAFQEVDIVGITRPCTKHNYLVTDIHQLARTIHEAFYIARSGRPGPVLVDLPKNIQQASIKPEFPEEVKIRSYQPTIHANPRQVKRALEMILEAKQPVFYTGGGIIAANASGELQALAEALQIPVTSTLMGLGASPATTPCGWACWGCTAPTAANMAVSQSDVLIAVGARFDDRVTGSLDAFAPTPRLSISTWTRAPSAKTWWCTSPSWATAGTPCTSSTSLMKPGRPPGLGRGAPGVAGESQGLDQKAPPQVPEVQGRHQAPVRGGETLGSHQGRRLSSPPRWARTRCGPPSSSSSSGPASS